METLGKSETQMFKTETNTTTPIMEKFKQLDISEYNFYIFIGQYLIRRDCLFSLGFPEESFNGVRILNERFPFPNYAQIANENKKAKISTESCSDNILKERVFEQTCSRCGTRFCSTDAEYLTNEGCYYHHGKFKQQWGNKSGIFLCCGKPENSSGCTVGQSHVCNGLANGLNDNIQGFVRTQPRLNIWVKPGIYALDCEMCYTVKGMELCKVSVVDMEGRPVYNSFVKPEHTVVDFNTRFSGVTEEDLAAFGNSLLHVQRELLNFIYEDTIIVGHSLNNDLRALKILHTCLIDLSLIFPHERGYPYRYSLKQLVLRCLRKEIQSSNHGHNSLEDATSCMELLIWKFMRDILGEVQ